MPTCQRQTTLSLSAEGWSTVEGEVTFYIPPHTHCCWGSTFPNDWPNTKGSGAAATTRSEGCCGCGRCVGYVKADKETTERSKCFRPPIFFRSGHQVSSPIAKVDCVSIARMRTE